MSRYVTEFFVPQNIIWAIILFILIIGKINFGLNYISVIDIIKNHYTCFRNTKGKILIVPVIIYSLVPFLMGYATTLVKVIDSDTINMVTVIISILTTALFTLLSMIIDMNRKTKKDTDRSSSEAKVLREALIETYYTVMFEILIGVMLLILCFLSCFTQEFGNVYSFAIYSLTYLLIINLLMILKRISKVINFDMKK